LLREVLDGLDSHAEEDHTRSAGHQGSKAALAPRAAQKHAAEEFLGIEHRLPPHPIRWFPESDLGLAPTTDVLALARLWRTGKFMGLFNNLPRIGHGRPLPADYFSTFILSTNLVCGTLPPRQKDRAA
jgi:hypothetical protein